jgi:hypothetical protein
LAQRLPLFTVDGRCGNNGDATTDGISLGAFSPAPAGKKSSTGHPTQRRATRFEGAGCSAPLAISENGDITIVTKLAQSFGELLVRIEGEYREMPGLNLSVTQAERLWGLDRHTCTSVLTTLMERRVLKRTTSGTYLQRSSG